ncbi:hypothetical protein [Kurthia sibirica]|uniref:hypothetical protein n=1 Tax=Kurthia sibirica TaxID=202750 RepID=UPI00116FBE39|nr:hypothetical protein [Kurthia sibirica]GEK35509.1 hypothetical protein KSI01_30420 [Kurthia sibirica]
MPKFVVGIEDLFVVEAATVEEAEQVAFKYMSEPEHLTFMVQEEMDAEETNWK